MSALQSISSRLCFFAAAISVLSSDVAFAQNVDRATSQTVFVPSYSRVLIRERRSQPLATTLVVHNVDPEEQIEVNSIRYFDRAGQLLETFVDEKVSLAPFQSMNALAPIDSVGDGIGANFVLTWSSQAPALPPLVEAIMVGGSGNQGISFTSAGRVISQKP